MKYYTFIGLKCQETFQKCMVNWFNMAIKSGPLCNLFWKTKQVCSKASTCNYKKVWDLTSTTQVWPNRSSSSEMHLAEWFLVNKSSKICACNWSDHAVLRKLFLFLCNMHHVRILGCQNWDGLSSETPQLKCVCVRERDTFRQWPWVCQRWILRKDCVKIQRLNRGFCKPESCHEYPLHYWCEEQRVWREETCLKWFCSLAICLTLPLDREESDVIATLVPQRQGSEFSYVS